MRQTISIGFRSGDCAGHGEKSAVSPEDHIPGPFREGHISLFGYLLFNYIQFFVVLNQLSVTSYMDSMGMTEPSSSQILSAASKSVNSLHYSSSPNYISTSRANWNLPKKNKNLP